MQIQRKISPWDIQNSLEKKERKKRKKKFPITVKLSNYPRKIQP